MGSSVVLETSKKKKARFRSKNKRRAPDAVVSVADKIVDSNDGETVGAAVDAGENEPKMAENPERLDTVNKDKSGLTELERGQESPLEQPLSIGLETSTGKKKSKRKRTRRAPDMEVSVADKIVDTNDGEALDAVDFDENEATMAEKLERLDITSKDKTGLTEPEGRQKPLAQPPSADSVHVLLKQALHADDKALLLACLYNQDQKVITNSVSLLNPADIFKLFNSLLSCIQSRGAVLMCTLPWLKSLLLQHASRIASHESSLVALNSLYQLIESRVATLDPAMKLASCLETMFAGVADDDIDEPTSVSPPVIYEDKDSDEEELSDAEAMETDGEEAEGSSVVSDAEPSDEDVSS